MSPKRDYFPKLSNWHSRDTQNKTIQGLYYCFSNQKTINLTPCKFNSSPLKKKVGLEDYSPFQIVTFQGRFLLNFRGFDETLKLEGHVLYQVPLLKTSPSQKKTGKFMNKILNLNVSAYFWVGFPSNKTTFWGDYSAGIGRELNCLDRKPSFHITSGIQGPGLQFLERYKPLDFETLNKFPKKIHV